MKKNMILAFVITLAGLIVILWLGRPTEDKMEKPEKLDYVKATDEESYNYMQEMDWFVNEMFEEAE